VTLAAVAGLALAGCGGSKGSGSGVSPTITSSSNVHFVAGTPGTFKVTAEGTPTPSLSLNAVTSEQPGPSTATWLHFQDHHNGTATLSGTAPQAAGGLYRATIIASSSVSLDSQALTIEVKAAPSIASPSSLTVRVGQNVRFHFLSVGYPAARPKVTGTLPLGLALTAGPGSQATTLSGTTSTTPNSGGVYPLTVTAFNGIGTSAIQQFVLTVAITPEFTGDLVTNFASGQPASYTVTTKSYPTAALSVVGALPAGLQFVDNHDGSATISGTLIGGAVPTHDIVAILAQNSVGLSRVAHLRINIVSIISPNHAIFKVGVAKTFTFAINKKGIPVHPAVTGALPAGLSLSEPANTTSTLLSGAPAAGTKGSYPLTVSVNLGTGPPMVQLFTLTVVG
jgi:hypothetical protein